MLPGILLFPLLLFVAISCASKKKFASPKPLIYDIASKTRRPDIITQSTIALYGYNFTIEYAYANDNHSALRTDWRLHEGTFSGDELGAPIRMRDRALIHLSPRGYQGNREALVASRIQFEIQIQIDEDDKWQAFEADEVFRKEYMEIVDVIQTRLHSLGYQFN
jgi:hypothetical protein